MKIKIKLLHPDAIMPSYAHPGDAGLDIYSLEDCVIAPQKIKRFNLGFTLELPVGYVSIMMDRSGLALKGIHNVAGVIDAGYRGEYACALSNLSSEPVEIKKSDRISQLVIIPCAAAELKLADELSDSARGTGGFGSTGK